ncbi:MAG: NAD(P)-binding domain-containing protein [Thermomicrobiales bacterium]|nr:NAD(P)-binding domain-containing protein [Thermomicrobiales bacterium]
MPIDTLVIGAGPFGLSLAAGLAARGVDYRIIGTSMSFWKQNMPPGMFLRSSWDWHLDPQGEWTIERFLGEQNLTTSEVNPIPIAVYLDYVEWFRVNARIEPENLVATRVDWVGDGRFIVATGQGESIEAKTVVLALGFSSFSSVPPELAAMLPAERVRHTVDANDFAHAAGKRYLIVGGRQSAFEWAALLAEAGAKQVDVVHRHASPAFAEADWTWVPPLMDRMMENPAWYRLLTSEEKEHYRLRLWGEGRLKVEPWLEARIAAGPVAVRPQTSLAGATPSLDGLTIQLSSGDTVEVDEVILATGYKPDIGRLGLLSEGNVLAGIDTDNGLPILDTAFQTSVPGLYMTSLLASRDFGPFFGFTVAARGAATVLGDHLAGS